MQKRRRTKRRAYDQRASSSFGAPSLASRDENTLPLSSRECNRPESSTVTLDNDAPMYILFPKTRPDHLRNKLADWYDKLTDTAWQEITPSLEELHIEPHFQKYLKETLAPSIKQPFEDSYQSSLILLGYLWYVSRKIIPNLRAFELDETVIQMWCDAGRYWTAEIELRQADGTYPPGSYPLVLANHKARKR